jgi:hypothetical protein
MLPLRFAERIGASYEDPLAIARVAVLPLVVSATPGADACGHGGRGRLACRAGACELADRDEVVVFGQPGPAAGVCGAVQTGYSGT